METFIQKNHCFRQTLMNKNVIEQHIHNKKYQQALALILDSESNTDWSHIKQFECYRGLKQYKAAEKLATELAIDLPDNILLQRHIAGALKKVGKNQQAAHILLPLQRSYPDNIDITSECALVMMDLDNIDETIHYAQQAIRLSPTRSDLHAFLGRMLCRSGSVRTGINAYYRAAALAPNNTDYLSRIAFWKNYLDGSSPWSSYYAARLWATRTFGEPNKTRPKRVFNPERKLKIGIISPDFCAHAASFFMLAMLKGIDKNQFEITLFHSRSNIDHVGKAIRERADNWVEVHNLHNDAIYEQIQQHSIDVLFDVNGHTAGNHLSLFARQAAPVQVSWLGYPATTGLTQIQYRITDEIADPCGVSDHMHAETLLRLPSGFLCFEPLENSPAVTLPSNSSTIRFGSFNNLAKISETTLKVWSQVLKAVPNSTLYLKRQQLKNDQVSERVLQAFEQRGIDRSRIILRTSKAKIEQHLEEYSEIDIALDTSPYNGTTTTIEALWMGVPVVTLCGQTHASRVSSSILHRVGLDELSCESASAYVSICEKLANDYDKRLSLRQHLRQTLQNSALFNSQNFGKELGSSIRDIWRSYCKEQLATSNTTNNEELEA